jgi:hypothetical protein
VRLCSARKTGGRTQSFLGKLATRAGSRSGGRTCATNGPRGDLPPSVHPAPCVGKNRCFDGGVAIESVNKSGNGSHNCKVAVDPRGDSVQGILTVKMNIIQPLRPSCPQFTAPTVAREFRRQKKASSLARSLALMASFQEFVNVTSSAEAASGPACEVGWLADFCG